jgi:hypothetical protein
MKFKGTLVFGFLVVLVSGYAIYDYRNENKSFEEASDENRLFPGVGSDKIKSLNLKNRNGELQVDNNNGKWVMSKPIPDGVNRKKLEEFFSNFLILNIKEADTEGAVVDWAKYGLDKPAQQISIEFTDGKKSTLDFGTVRAFDESFYVRKDGGDRVFIADVSWFTTIDKNGQDLRNTTLFHPNGAEPNGFSVKIKGKKGYAFKIIDGKWTLDGQPKFQTDDSAITEFINKIRHLEGDRILADDKSPMNVRKHNLSPPKVDIAVTFEGELGQWALEISDEAAISSNMPAIYQLQAAKLAGLTPELSHFRNKFYPFSFDQGKARYIRILKKGDQFETRYSKINDVWELDIENPHLQVDPAKIDELLNDIRSLTATTYLGRASWSSKSLQENRIQLLDVLHRELFVLEFGGEHPAPDQKLYLAKTNMAEEVFAVSKEAIDKITAKNVMKDQAAEPGSAAKEDKK